MIAHVDDLAHIVEDLRTLGLFSAGQLEPKLGRIDLGEEANAVVAAIKHDLSEAGITIERDLGRAMVIADRDRVRQVLFRSPGEHTALCTTQHRPRRNESNP